MPRVTIWIRNEDMSKWEAIDNRPDWLHECLNSLESIKGAVALEDIKKGEFGSVMLHGPLVNMAAENKRFDYLEEHPDEKLEFTGLDFLKEEPHYEPLDDAA